MTPVLLLIAAHYARKLHDRIRKVCVGPISTIGTVARISLIFVCLFVTSTKVWAAGDMLIQSFRDEPLSPEITVLAAVIVTYIVHFREDASKAQSAFNNNKVISILVVIALAVAFLLVGTNIAH